MDPATALPEVENAPVIDWESDENTYKTRFESYRSEADRRATELSQKNALLEDLRSDDPDRQRAAATTLGFDLVEDEPVEYDDPSDELRAELEALKGQFTQLSASQEAEKVTMAVEAQLDALDLDEEDKDWVLAGAIKLPVLANGLPDIASAHAKLVARDETRMNAAMAEWQKTKRAPRSIKPGVTATEQKSIEDMTDVERIEWAVARYEDQGA